VKINNNLFKLNYIMNLNRETLYYRHRLSHQQIDMLLGENNSSSFADDKMKILRNVKNFITVTDLFRKELIPFVPIKGPILSYRIYNDPAVRFSHDIDLLILLDDLTKVIDLLLGRGFRIIDCSCTADDFRRKLIIKNSHHMAFYNDKLQFCVEVHWTLTCMTPISNDELMDIVHKNLIQINFAGRLFVVLNKEMELVYLILHGARHGWCRLKWLIDIAYYPMDDLNMDLFYTLVNRFSADKVVKQTDQLLNLHFHRHLPFKTSNKPLGYIFKYAEYSINRENVEPESLFQSYKHFRYLFLLFPNVSYKLKCVKAIFLSMNDVANFKFSSQLAYYLYRPVSLIRRRILHV